MLKIQEVSSEEQFNKMRSQEKPALDYLYLCKYNKSIMVSDNGTLLEFSNNDSNILYEDKTEFNSKNNNKQIGNLIDNISKYNKIIIFYKTFENLLCSKEIEISNSNNVNISLDAYYNNNYYISNLNINNTSFELDFSKTIENRTDNLLVVSENKVYEFPETKNYIIKDGILISIVSELSASFE